jgi:hypothetical protein
MVLKGTAALLVITHRSQTPQHTREEEGQPQKPWRSCHSQAIASLLPRPPLSTKEAEATAGGYLNS